MDTTPHKSEDVTILMNAAAGGDRGAADRLLPLVYEQLRKAAQVDLAGERSGHTLSATALVHEAYLRLVGPARWLGGGGALLRGGCGGDAAGAAGPCEKARGRERRGSRGGRGRVEFASVAELAVAEDPEEIVSFDGALRRLEVESGEMRPGVCWLRFFLRLSVEQTAQAMGVSERTVNRLWTFARAWLHRAVREEERKD